MPGRKTREYTRYSPAIFSPSICFVYTLLRSDDGAEEQEYPGGAYYDVEFPADQE